MVTCDLGCEHGHHKGGGTSYVIYMGPGGYQGMMALLAFFACLEKLCSLMNLVAVEKDWVSPRMQHHNPYLVDGEALQAS